MLFCFFLDGFDLLSWACFLIYFCIIVLLLFWTMMFGPCLLFLKGWFDNQSLLWKAISSNKGLIFVWIIFWVKDSLFRSSIGLFLEDFPFWVLSWGFSDLFLFAWFLIYLLSSLIKLLGVLVLFWFPGIILDWSEIVEFSLKLDLVLRGFFYLG